MKIILIPTSQSSVFSFSSLLFTLFFAGVNYSTLNAGNKAFDYQSTQSRQNQAEGMPQEYDDQCVSGLSYKENPRQRQVTTILPHSLVVSPNPASAGLTVFLPEGFTGNKLLVMDMYGRTMLTVQISGDRHLSIETFDWPNGTYFISVGHDLKTKFIISH